MGAPCWHSAPIAWLAKRFFKGWYTKKLSLRWVNGKRTLPRPYSTATTSPHPRYYEYQTFLDMPEMVTTLTGCRTAVGTGNWVGIKILAHFKLTPLQPHWYSLSRRSRVSAVQCAVNILVELHSFCIAIIVNEAAFGQGTKNNTFCRQCMWKQQSRYFCNKTEVKRT